MAIMKNLDLKDGKEIFCSYLSSIDESKNLSDQYLGEDLFALQFDDCLIDVGMYGDHALTIQVICIDKGSQDWANPYCCIRCFEIDDFYIQLQRAIELYPGRMPK